MRLRPTPGLASRRREGVQAVAVRLPAQARSTRRWRRATRRSPNAASALELSEGELRQHRARVEQLEAGLRPALARGGRRSMASSTGCGPSSAVERARVERFEEIGAQARGQATRIRMQALRDAVDLSARLERARARRPTHTRGRLLESVREAIQRLGAERSIRPRARERRVATDGRDVRGHDRGRGRAAGRLLAAGRVRGRRRARSARRRRSRSGASRAGRATLEMQLAEPVELLRELEQRSPFEFRVRDRRFDRLVLDVEPEEADAP